MAGILLAGPVSAQQIRPTTTPHVDPKAVALLDQVTATLRDAQTVQGTVRTTYRSDGKAMGTPVTTSVWAKKPGYLRIDTGGDATPNPAPAEVAAAPAAPVQSAKTSSGSNTLAAPSGIVKQGNSTIITGDALIALLGQAKATGKRTHHVYTPQSSWSNTAGTDTLRQKPRSAFAQAVADEDLQAFFDLRANTLGAWTPGRLDELLLRAVRYDGKQPCSYAQGDDAQCDVVTWTYERTYTLPEDTIVYTTKFYIGPDHLLRRKVTTGSNGYETDRAFSLRVGAPVSDEVFSSAQMLTPGAPVISVLATPDQLPSSPGAYFPALSRTATLLDAGTASMDALFGKSDVLVMWLWAYNCSSCREEFPIAEQLSRVYANKGVTFTALAYAPGDEAVARQVRRFNRAAMPILFGATSWYETMQNTGNTVVMIDRDGKVLYNGIFDRQALTKVLAERPAARTTQR